MKIYAFGGLAGSGKSTNAKLLSFSLDAAHIEADRVRKDLWGVSHENNLPQYAYALGSPIPTKMVLDVMCARAKEALKTRNVILDMTFMSEYHVRRAESLARDCFVDFTGIWCKTSRNTMFKRIANRWDTASDAGVEVLEMMLKNHNNTAPNGWLTLDTGKNEDDVFLDLRSKLGI